MKITLLDNKQWDINELKEKAYDDEFYYGYLGKYALSSTSIKHLLSSPKTYYNILQYGSQQSQALRDGWLFHTCVLEPHVFEEQIFVNVQSKNTKKNVSKKKRTKKNAVPVRPEIRAGGRTRPVHVPVSAEQRFANKLARETATGRTVEVVDKDLGGVKFTVIRHVDGSLFLLQEEGTKNEYWAKWKMKDDLWIIWNDNYGEETDDHHNAGNENAEGAHRSSCCYTVNRRRLANVPYCLACKDDSPTQRTNRRIANGGPEANLIFDENGQLTTAWTQKAKEIYLNRLREEEEK